MTDKLPLLKTMIVGGSLSGLMAGNALARQGHEVTLLERADRHRPSGRRYRCVRPIYAPSLAPNTPAPPSR
ncbi:NAD(P)-binding protein [Rothia sp. AR01]|uniref:NAD(P)-binding protein n=1 Tax=Rothia santali TaxID=2949643 RepID=A0A9X2HDF1_9MICC|nr:NAD(P)-binding protein [Rothia santali]MCP3425134.1 NAD(P)-binding protein [Rothia santali]